MASAFDWIIIISGLLVLVVAVEFYLSEYRYQRSNISLSLAADDNSTWRMGQSGVILEHRLTLENTGQKSGRIDSFTVEDITLTSEDGESSLDGHPTGDFRHFPDGPRIPANHKGRLIVKTQVNEWVPSQSADRSTIVVELEAVVSDQLGEYTCQVTDPVVIDR